MKKPSKKLVSKIIHDRKVRRDIARQSHEWFFAIYLNHYIKSRAAPFHTDFFRITENAKIKNAVIIAFRNSAKSTIFNLTYPLWAILGDQQKKLIVIASQTQRQARQHLLNIKKELETNILLKMDLGPFKEETDEWGSLALVIPRYGAKILASSTEQSIRGIRHGQYRPDLIIGDDLEDLESVKTQESRDKLFAWFNGDVIPAGDLHTRIIIIGNLLHNDSLLMKLIQNIKSKKFDGIYRRYPLIDENEQVTWPGKFPNHKSIDDLKRTMDERAFQREFMLNILPDDDQVIHPEWIQYYDTLPDVGSLDYRFTGIGIDLAISESNSADFTAMISARVYGTRDNLKIYILPNPINKRFDFPTALQQAKQLSRSMEYAHLFIESVAYQSAFFQQLRDEGFPAEEFKIGGNDKRTRLIMTAPAIQSAKVLFPRQGAEILINQILGFGRERHDDLIDAFTTLVIKVFEKDTAIDEYSYLLTKERMEQAYISKMERWTEPFRIGVVTTGAGRMFSTIVLKAAISGQVMYQDAHANPTVIADQVIELVKRFNIKPSNIFVETFGLGEEVYELLRNQLDNHNWYIAQKVVAVKPGSDPEFPESDGKNFINLRSQSCWRLKNWVEKNLVLLENNAFNQLSQVQYKVHGDKKIGVKTRDEMMHDGLSSPDAIDALALTFSREREIELRRPYVQPPYVARCEYEGGARSYDE